jgi:hypothetical protein
MAREIAHGFEWFTLNQLPSARTEHIVSGVKALWISAPMESLRFRRISLQPKSALHAIANSNALDFNLTLIPSVAEERPRQTMYAAAYAAGEPVDPIVVYALGITLLMIDGYTRLQAAREVGLEAVDAYTLRPSF